MILNSIGIATGSMRTSTHSQPKYVQAALLDSSGIVDSICERL